MPDCLVIGGGPAGLLAAVYLGRYRRSVSVIDAGDSRAALIPASHNYPGFAGVSGPDLLQRLSDNARTYGAHLVRDRVTVLETGSGRGFLARVGSTMLQAPYVLLATGIVDRCPPIEGYRCGHPSEVVRFCPVCDAYEACDRRIAVLGDIATAGRKAMFLRTYSSDIRLFVTHGSCDDKERDELRDRGVTVVPGLRSIVCDSPTTAALISGTGERHEVDAVYPMLGCSVRSQLATALGAQADQIGSLRVDDHQCTTVPGLYAAGDVVTDLHQLSVAFGHAAIAATAIHNRLPRNLR